MSAYTTYCNKARARAQVGTGQTAMVGTAIVRRDANGAQRHD